MNLKCKHVLPIIFLISLITGEPISLGIAVGTAISFSGALFSYDYLRCKVYECCNENWVKLNSTSLLTDLKKRLYGQHLVTETVVRATKAHLNNKDPRKALVISFHGWTGSGKNYVADMIAQNFYHKAKQSAYVKLFFPELFSESDCKVTGKDCVQLLQSVIINTVKLCARSLFIFDEMDQFDPKLINALRPFLEHHSQVNGIDFRKSMFIFLSNTGGDDISSKTLEYWQHGEMRDKIHLADMEKIIIDAAFNEEGGLKFSFLIKNNLIDHFVPFLPMERSHVLLCIQDYLSVHKKYRPEQELKFVAEVADSLQYFPKGLGLFSTSGCKRIAQKVDLLIEQELEAKEAETMKENDHAHDHL